MAKITSTQMESTPNEKIENIYLIISPFNFIAKIMLGDDYAI
jgi:hypothetical protein